jgi:alkanesulfonate monooxygenase SsuD/methylene tetrahydromethanopterin reductase-like flavin-dependent oxidoreductase (luciferase family)
VSFAGQEFRVNAGPLPVPDGLEVPVLVAALGPRLLRVAGQYTAGTIPWMANAQAIETASRARTRALLKELARS